MTERHLTIKELAERCGVPPKTVYEWNHKGTGPRYMRLGGKFVRYRLSDVLNWEEQQVHPASGRHAGKACRP